MTKRDPIRLQYLQAVKVVGTTDDEHLAWLLRFAEGHGAADQLESFLGVRMLQAARGRDLGPVGTHRPTAIALPIDGKVDAPLVDRLRKELARQLGSLRRNATATFNVPNTVTLLWNNPTRWGRRPDTIGGIPWDMAAMVKCDPATYFYGEVVAILRATHDRLRVCAAPGCEEMFLALRPHQLHCSSRCTNRSTQARYRAQRGKADVAAARRRQRAALRRRQRAAAAGIPVDRVASIRAKEGK